MNALRVIHVLLALVMLAGCGGGGGGDSGGGSGGGGSNSFMLGGAVTGLSGSLGLAFNGGNNLLVNASGNFSFSTTLTNGTTYAVGIYQQPAGQVCTITSGVSGTISGANVTSVAVACANLSIGGSVSGLTQAGLVLQLNNANDLAIAANSSGFTFPSSASLGASPFYVTHIKAQPTGQTCTILKSTGIVTAAAPTISGTTAPAVACVDNATDAFMGTYQIDNSPAYSTSHSRAFITFNADGTYIMGLRNDDASCAANNGNGVNYGVYRWNHTTQVMLIVNRVLDTTGDCGIDPGSTATLTGNADGSVSWIVTDGTGPHESARLTPVPSTTGSLVGSWGDNQGFVAFSDPANGGKIFSVTTKSIVQNSAAFPGVEDGCYTLTGTTSSGTITTNFSSTCTVAADGRQGMDTSGPVGYSGVTAAINVTVSGDSITAPAGPVPPIYGTTARNVPTQLPSALYSVTATVTGLGVSSSGLVLRNNGGGNIAVTANGATTIATGVTTGAPYLVAIASQPTDRQCTVANGSGTVASANVANITVTCGAVGAPYTVGGTVNGLTGVGTGLILRNNGGDDLTISAAGAFTFATGLPTGRPYAVTVWQQPAGQYCIVSNGSPVGGVSYNTGFGVATSNVTSVVVNCTPAPTTLYSLGGTISGLSASGLVLAVSNDKDIAVSSGATTFTAASGIPVSTGYLAYIKAQPTGQTCTIVNPAGAIPNTGPANVSNIQVACVPNTFNPLVGTYRITANGEAIPDVITFFSNGTYILASLDEDDPTCNGVEYGVYRWNQSTNAFAFVNAVVDTNNDCGVRDGAALLAGTLTKNGTTLTADLIDTNGSGTHIPVVFTPVRSVDGTLIGAWTGLPQLGFTVYFDEDAVLNVGASSVTIGSTVNPPGLEHACYGITSGNTATGSLAFNFSPTCSPRDMTVVDTLVGGLSGFLSNPVNFAVVGDVQATIGQRRSVAQ